MKQLASILAACVLLTSSACKRDESTPPCDDPRNPSCPNYDSCLVKVPLTAGFTIRELDRDDNAPYKSAILCDDTGVTNMNAMHEFTADVPDADSYEWRIGAGVYNTRTVGLIFPRSHAAPFEISLTVKRRANGCFPLGDTVASATRKLWISLPTSTKVLGTYKGTYTDDPSREYTIRLRLIESRPMGGDPRDLAVIGGRDGDSLACGNLFAFRQFISQYMDLGLTPVRSGIVSNIWGKAILDSSCNRIRLVHVYTVYVQPPSGPTRTDSSVFVGIRQ